MQLWEITNVTALYYPAELKTGMIAAWADSEIGYGVSEKPEA
jgi:hypothetical protein